MKYATGTATILADEAAQEMWGESIVKCLTAHERAMLAELISVHRDAMENRGDDHVWMENAARDLRDFHGATGDVPAMLAERWGNERSAVFAAFFPTA